MKKVNWKLRIKNPWFWIMVFVIIMANILQYLGMKASDITTWPKLFDVLVRAVANPYCVFVVVCALIGVGLDPTTKGLSDSKAALSYILPKAIDEDSDIQNNADGDDKNNE